MKTLLTLKHWQAFALLFGLPFVFQVFTMLAIAINQSVTTITVVLPLLVILVMTLYFGWFYTLGVNLHQKLPSTVFMNLRKFKLFLFFPIVYILLLVVMVFIFLAGMTTDNTPSPAILLVILPLHLFSVFCIFYCLYFIAKALKSVESRQDAKFSDFALEFVLIWMFPIGIWIIQPRLNKIFDPHSIDSSEQALDAPFE